MDVTTLLLILENPLIGKRLKRKRRCWSHEINLGRSAYGEFVHLFPQLEKDPERFHGYFRMSVDTFNDILQKIQSRLQKQNNNFRVAISPTEKLAVALRALAHSFSTVSDIVKETCDAIWEELQPLHLAVPSEDDLRKISKEFFDKWNFPNCFGCIDGKHIRIKCPSNSGSMFYNYKQYFSIVLQAVADANCRFIFVDIGAFGKQSEGGIFRDSALYQHLISGNLNIPSDHTLPGTDIKVPFVLLGDEAYPLSDNLLKPFPRNQLDRSKRVFNYRLSRARRVVECAFGILAAKWRILLKPIECNPENAEKIVKCICVLHNIILDKEGLQTDTTNINADVIANRKNNSSTENARDTRNKFMAYFISPNGAVQFQDNMI